MCFSSFYGRAVALILVVVLLTGCGGGGSTPPTPTNAAPVASGVAISGTALSGSLLTGNYTYADAEGDAQATSTLRWMRSASSGGTGKVAINGASTRTYTVADADQGAYLFFCVTPVSVTGTSPGVEVCSTATIAVPVAANTMVVMVDAGPDNSGYNVNRLYASVTICHPGSSTLCQTIDHVLVDTGSTGLRLLSSTVPGSLNLTRLTGNTGFPLLSCVQFVDNTVAWGPVVSADVVFSGKTATSVPIQVIADPAFGTPAANCSIGGISMTTARELGANGILGLGLFKNDCGADCSVTTHNGSYYTCTDSTCRRTVGTVASVDQQLKNPVPLFAQDNNGILIELPAVATATAATLTGTLTFGIYTQSNNQFAPGTLLTTDTLGNFTTSLAGRTYTSSFFDTGSNGLFFDSTAIIPCGANGAGFYCPDSLTSFSANLMGANAVGGTVSFAIENATSLFGDGSQHVLPALAGPLGDGASFDWGLPFFYGRRLFIGIEGQPSSLGTGPFYAF